MTSSGRTSPGSQPLASGVEGPGDAQTGSGSTVTEGDVIYNIVEEKAERMLQLRLLHIFYHVISSPFAVRQSPEVESTWQMDIPQIAFEHDNLLYAIFAVSTTWLLRSQPNNVDLQIRRDRYVALALQEQRQAIDQLSESNADAVSFAAVQIQLNSFAMLNERIQPIAGGYEATVEWLKTGNGAGRIFSMAAEAAKTNSNRKFQVVLNAPPAFPSDGDDHLPYGIPPQSRDVLEGSLVTKEGLSPATRDVYEQTLRYLGILHHYVSEGKPGYFAARSIQGFAMLVPKEFTRLVEEGRPVALVVLAHFFALAAQVEDKPAWLGDAPRKAIHAISRTLHGDSDTILQEMEWPCKVASAK